MLILTVLQGPDKGRRFELPDNEPQQIGRSGESLPLSDQTISRRHAELTPDNGRWYIRDLQSANGTFVNGVRVKAPRVLDPGDQIRTGVTLFVFGQELRRPRTGHGVRVVSRSELDAVVERTAVANEDSMVMAVPEPSEAAVVQLKVVYELTQLIGSTVERQELLEKVMDLIFNNFHADRGFILLLKHPDERPDPAVIRHRNPPRDKLQHITVSRSIVHHVMKHGEAVLSSNAMTDKRFAGDSVRGLAIRSAMCAPIKYKDRLFGVIQIDSQIANFTFTDDQLRLLTAIGIHTGLALANLELYADRIQQEKLAAVGQAVASLSHSIKNILQGLRGGADVVELGMKKDNMKVVKGGWDIVSRNLNRIMELTMNMLAYSKQRKPELELANLNRVLQEIVDLVQTQFDSRKVALIADLDVDMPPVPIDPGGIHQAVLNLLNNALEAVEPESGIVTLRSEYDDKQQQVRIRVIDNGEGIERERLERLFQPFQSTKGLRGTGLGLVVTKKIIEEHGGTVDVQSRKGQGSTFTLMLPFAEGMLASMDDTHGPGDGSAA